MLPIILFLLKLIGIILAFIVVIVLLILVVPIRYQIYVQKEEKFLGKAKIHYLLRMFQIKVDYKEDKLYIKASIFGKNIYESETKEDRNESKVKMKKNRKIDKIKGNSVNKQKISKSKTKKQKSKNKEILNQKTKNKEVKNKETKYREASSAYAKSRIIRDKKLTEDTNLTTDTKMIRKSKLCDVNEQMIEQQKIDEQEIETLEKVDNSLNNTLNSGQDIIDENTKSESKIPRYKNIFKKIRNALDKINGLSEKIRSLRRKLDSFIVSIKDKIKRITIILSKIKLFLEDDINRDSFKNIFFYLKKIGKHIMPKHLKGQVEFGKGDPYETGKILALSSMAYGLYGKHVRIYPNFEEEVLKGDLLLKGRIRLGTLLIIGVRMVLYKNNRQLVKNIMKLKEEL